MTILLLLLPLTAAAQLDIKKIDISVLVRDNGDASVTERRTMVITNKLTEGYIVMDNMGDLTLSGFGVSDETGLEYQVLPKWNINASRQEKAGKCGIVEKGRGSYELCWGLGGKVDGSKEKVYTIKYTIGSLAKGYYEADGFNHQFLADQMDPLPEEVDISVEVEGFPIDTSNARGWGFGFNGETSFKDEAFRIHTDNYTYSSSAIIMLALKKGIINPKDTIPQRFQDVVDRALEYSNFGEENEGEREPWVFDPLAQKLCSFLGIDNTKTVERVSDSFLMLMFGLFLLFCFYAKTILEKVFYVITLKPLFIFLRKRRARKVARSLSGGSGWIRTLPFNGSVFASQKALNYLSYKGKNDLNNAIGAYILRLFQQGRLALTNDQGKETVRVIYDKNEQPPQEPDGRRIKRDVEMENILHYIFLSASGKDHILQPDELKMWLRAHTLYAGKLLRLNETGTYKDKTELGKLEGFKKFLKDFTLIDERGVVEVELWDEYLVFATLFGMADQVMADFRKVCPEYFQMSRFARSVEGSRLSFSSTVRNLAGITYYSARKSYVAAVNNATSSSIWSGGGGGSRGGYGGRSSFGGGGGHSGGGHGGGGR